MSILYGSLFEENFLIRSLGALATAPDIALSELVANAWDAGATKVNITVPSEEYEEIIVEDNGSGLTLDEFRKRWMTLGYNRLKYQGEIVEFPEDNTEMFYRRAFGRNGVGRHGMLCFADQYTVETFKNGVGSRFVVAVSSGAQPFTLLHEEQILGKKHGTILRAKVVRNLPGEQHVRDIISARFLHDPRFEINVNDISIELMQHKGLIANEIIRVREEISLEVFIIDSTKIAKTARQHGVAFWVGNRLVGEPSWTLGEYSIDGRTSFARRHTVVIRTNDLFNEVLPDWSSFKRIPIINEIQKVVANYIEKFYRQSMSEKIGETRRSVVQQHRKELSDLPTSAKIEVSNFIEQLTEQVPTVNQDLLSAAVQAVIHLEKSRSGVNLLHKLSILSDEDVAGLDRLLSDWSVKDALTVLDEIDKRLMVIEALARFSVDDKTNELKTLHPLVLQSRWLFGPEFDSPLYSSNISLVNAMSRLFKAKAQKEDFYNYRNRPDIIVLDSSTLSAVGTEEFDDNSQLCKMRRILIIELKRGGFTIGRDEMDQAMHYVEDLINSGHLDGNPFINAFVVGHETDKKINQSRIRKVGENPENGRVEAITYGQLVRTAQQRLFRLRDQLKDRYEGITNENIVQKVLNEPYQIELVEEDETA